MDTELYLYTVENEYVIKSDHHSTTLWMFSSDKIII